jgi:hypothetical protein
MPNLTKSDWDYIEGQLVLEARENALACARTLQRAGFLDKAEDVNAAARAARGFFRVICMLGLEQIPASLDELTATVLALNLRVSRAVMGSQR